MKKLILCCGLASAMLATNCSKDDVSEPTGSQPKATITASIEQQEEDSESRTSLSSGNILWADGDAIRLVNQTNTANSDVFTLTGGKGTTNGTFEGNDIGTGAKNALYPASIYTSVAGDGTFTLTLPATQNYAAETFGANANPMVAKSDGTNTLQFKNLCGAIRFQLTGTATITSIKIETVSEKIAGAATVSMAYSDVPALAVTGTTILTLSNINVALNAVTAKNFYVVFPAGTYAAGLKVTVTDSNNRTFTQTTKSAITIVRSKVTPLKAYAFAPTINFPDANLRVALGNLLGLTLTADGTDIDLNSAANLAAINATTSLDLSSKSLTSLKGIELFTNLQTLKVNGNQLLTLDLSKNTKLTTLDCSANAGLASLNVKSNGLLTSLTCNNCALATLDVSGNPELLTLTCNNNPLTTLNVTANTKLTSLNCSHCTLTTLTLTGITALLTLDCSNNPNLNALSITNKTKLQTLNCSSCKLESLTLTNNTALVNLNCSSNSIETLNLSKNTNLVTVNCSANQLGSLDISALTKLDIANNFFCGAQKTQAGVAKTLSLTASVTQKLLLTVTWLAKPLNLNVTIAL